MGGDLASASSSAADLYRRAASVLGYDLLPIVRHGPEERLRETRFSQPAIFVTNYALCAEVGNAFAPVASAGHSFAEFCSLTLAGSLSFETALALVNERSLAMQAAAELAPGSMSAILGLDPQRLRAAVTDARTRGRVQLANFNAPGQIVISGDEAAVQYAGELSLAAGAKRVVALNVSGAWHSELMQPASVRFAKAVAAAPIGLPRIVVVSNVDAKPYLDVATVRRNLVWSITQEVRWHDASVRLLEEQLDLVVEFGASAVLTPMLKRLPSAPATISVGDLAGVVRLREMLKGAAA